MRWNQFTCICVVVFILCFYSCNQHYSHSVELHCQSFLLQLPHSWPLATTNVVFTSVILLSEECSMSGSIHYVTFSDCLFSPEEHPLEMIQPRCRVCQRLSSDCWVMSHGTDTPGLFSHSPTEGHLGCFQVLTVMNKVTMNIWLQNFYVTLGFHFSGVNYQECKV